MSQTIRTRQLSVVLAGLTIDITKVSSIIIVTTLVSIVIIKIIIIIIIIVSVFIKLLFPR